VVHGREAIHRREDNLQINVCNLPGMSLRVFFYCGRLGHMDKDCHKKKSDEATNKPRTHSGHYAEKSSNQDHRLFIASDDIDEPVNFDSQDLRLFVPHKTVNI
jgi:hypothetical protein